MLITCCKSKELERDKEETKREFRGNSDDFYFMLIKPIYRLIVRRPIYTILYKYWILNDHNDTLITMSFIYIKAFGLLTINVSFM